MMGTGKDLIDVGKAAQAVYESVKELKKNITEEMNAAAADIEKLTNLSAKLKGLLSDLPDDLTSAEALDALRTQRDTLELQLASLDPLSPSDEPLWQKTNWELGEIEGSIGSLAMGQILHPNLTANRPDLGRIQGELEALSVGTQANIRAKGYIVIASNLIILASKAAVLLAKASAA
jgi:hypothetical protein